MNIIYKFARNKKMKIGAVVATASAIFKILDIDLPWHMVDLGIVSGCFLYSFGFIDKIERYFKWSRVDKK